MKASLTLCRNSAQSEGDQGFGQVGKSPAFSLVKKRISTVLSLNTVITKQISSLGTSGLSTWPAGEALANWIGREEQEERCFVIVVVVVVVAVVVVGN